MTMDRQESWEEIIPPTIDVADANFVIHCDGGTRASKCSAAAWLLEAHVTSAAETQVFVLARSGIFFSEPLSSFTTELSAMESCIEAFARFWKALRSFA